MGVPVFSVPKKWAKAKSKIFSLGPRTYPLSVRPKIGKGPQIQKCVLELAKAPGIGPQNGQNPRSKI
jgi:hypothetical protein